MITYIKINGFKSFQNFEMEFTPLTIIAGTNASGKSNLFDAFQLLSRMAEVKLSTAFNEQRGEPMELFTQMGEGKFCNEMEFVVDLLLNRKVKDNWGKEVELNNTRLRYSLVISRELNAMGFEDLFVKKESLEKIRPEDDNWIKKFSDVKELTKTLRAGGSREPYIQTIEENGQLAIRIRQDTFQGGRSARANTISQTVLGGVDSADFPHVFAAKEEMRSWQFLQLNPDDLRQPTKQEPGISDLISSTGKNMAAVLHRIKQRDGYTLVEITRKLNSFLPNFIGVDVIDDQAGRQYLIKLREEDGKEYSSRVLSEGTLRLLLLCILAFDERHTGLLCFEEPENGINPFRIKAMVKLLKDLSTDFSLAFPILRQVIVNTHSPVLVGEMVSWQKDKNVSVHYAEMRTRILDLKEKKVKLSVTKIIPAFKETNAQLSLHFQEQEQKITITSIREYLQTTDFEQAQKMLN
jgi:predicted ATPase